MEDATVLPLPFPDALKIHYLYQTFAFMVQMKMWIKGINTLSVKILNYILIEQHLCFVKITLKFDKIYNVSNVFFHPQIFYWQNKNTIKLIVKLNKTNKNLSMWCFWWIAIRWNFSKFNHIFIWFFCLDNNFHFVFHYKGVSNSTPIF